MPYVPRRATSRRWCTPRVGYARQKNRLATLRLHHLDRPRRDQHGHRRRAGHHQPPAGAAAARRRLRHPRRQPGAAAARGPDARRTSRSTTASSPVSRFWDRINRPEQLIAALLEAMRVLTDPAETGAVTLALPQDVQAEAYDLPDELFEQARLARPPRRCAEAARARARRPTLLRGARRPLIVAGGGVHLLRGDRRAARLRRGDRHPGRRDAGRQGRAALRPPAGARRDRRDRHGRRQRARRARPTWSSASARAAPTSPPPRRPRSPTRTSRFVNINVAERRRLQARRRCRWSPTRARRSRRSAARSTAGASTPTHTARAHGSRPTGTRRSSAPTRPRTARCPPRAR